MKINRSPPLVGRASHFPGMNVQPICLEKLRHLEGTAEETAEPRAPNALRAVSLAKHRRLPAVWGMQVSPGRNEKQERAVCCTPLIEGKWLSTGSR